MGTGITLTALDECLHGRHVVQAFAHRHRRDQYGEPNGNQPQQVEPLVTADPQSRRDGPLVFHPAGPGLRVDDVLSKVQLCAIAHSSVPVAAIFVGLELFAIVRRGSYGGSRQIDMPVSATTFTLGLWDVEFIVAHRISSDLASSLVFTNRVV
jgi:hypothetical protein